MEFDCFFLIQKNIKEYTEAIMYDWMNNVEFIAYVQYIVDIMICMYIHWYLLQLIHCCYTLSMHPTHQTPQIPFVLAYKQPSMVNNIHIYYIHIHAVYNVYMHVAQLLWQGVNSYVDRQLLCSMHLSVWFIWTVCIDV